MIRCLRERKIKDWDVYLPQTAGAMRATVSRSTGFTADKLMLGREVKKSADLLFGVDKANKISVSSWLCGEAGQNFKLEKLECPCSEIPADA